MAKLVLTNARLLFGQYDITSYSNTVDMQVEREMKEATVFGESWENFRPGRKSWTASGGGYLDNDTTLQPDSALYASIAATGRLFTVGPDGGDAGDPALFGVPLTGSYSCFGSHGELAPWSVNLNGDTYLVKGHVLADSTTNSTENGTAYERGAVGATQYLYGAVHVTAFSGIGAATIKIQSDSVEAFTGSPEDQITFTAATAATYQFATPVAGAITDTWWRASVSAFTATSMTYTVVMGIQS